MAVELNRVYEATKQITFIFVGQTLPWQPTEFPIPILHYPGFDRGTLTVLASASDQAR